MVIVEDDNPNNQKGITYRSTKTPVLLQVQLKDNLDVKQNETQRIVSKDMIDLSVPATVST